MSEPRRHDDTDDQPPVPPTQPAADGDVLTPEDEAILDEVAAEMPDEVLQESIRRTQEWAGTIGKREGEHGK